MTLVVFESEADAETEFDSELLPRFESDADAETEFDTELLPRFESDAETEFETELLSCFDSDADGITEPDTEFINVPSDVDAGDAAPEFVTEPVDDFDIELKAESLAPVLLLVLTTSGLNVESNELLPALEGVTLLHRVPT